MALYPEGDKLDDFPSRYVLANLAARRAKQIRDGAPILVETTSTHPLTIALEEIADGAVLAGVAEPELVTTPAETLESIDLLSREAGALDTGLGDIGAILGATESHEGPSVTEFASLEESLIDEPTTEFEEEAITLDEPGGRFEEETISLDDLLKQEQEEELGDGDDLTGIGADEFVGAEETEDEL